MIGISFVCALFVGLTMAGGLATMLPIIRVLINGDTVPAWVNRTIIEQRLGVKLSEDPEIHRLILLRVEQSGIAHAYKLRGTDELLSPEASDDVNLTTALADPHRNRVMLQIPKDRDKQKDQYTIESVPLKAVPFYMVWAQQAAAILPPDPLKAIAWVFGLLFALALAGNIVRFFQEYLANKAAILAVNDVRRHLYDHVLRVPMSHFGQEGASDVTSRLVQDSLLLQTGFMQILGPAIQEPIKVVAAMVLALSVSWQLTLGIVLFAPVLGVVVRKFGKKMYRASRKQLQKSSSMLGQLEATLQGIRVVKTAGAERFERRRYRIIMDGLVNELLRMSRIDAFNTPTLEMLLLAATGGVVLFGGYLVLRVHHLGPDQFIVVMVTLASIGESLRRISKLSTTIQQSNAAAARIFEAMDMPVELDKNNRTTRFTRLPVLKNEIRFENITFSYPHANHPALVNVSLTVPKGQCVAIVGRNGSGKTTLLSLLPRLYEPQAGTISIDGVNIFDAPLKAVRRQISVVTQDSVIFPGTIAQNIAYGHPLASRLNQKTPTVLALRDEIESAAKRAFADDFILRKPHGYDTVLGEMGGQLSGGEKQRLCIARAILRKTPILILDEATSQVDAQSEHLIQQAIDDLIHAGPRTTFVIAHRLSTVRSADTIVVMERGHVVGQGTHEQLRVSCATYVELYQRQFHAA